MKSLNSQTIREAITLTELKESLKKLGLFEGMVLEAHTSLSSFGYVVGGAQTVVDAYLDCLGYDGTLVMPLQNRENTDPSNWRYPPVDRSLYSKIRSETPAFDKKASDAPFMGSVVDNFRRRDGVMVSTHPSVAFASWGKYARLICNRQPIHFPLGEDSPLSKLYELNGWVLLAGVSYDKCTCMHLAEYRSMYRPIIIQASAVEINGKRTWKKYLDLELDDSLFVEIGMELEKKIHVNFCRINDAECRLMRIRDVVDFTADYLKYKK